MSFPAIGWVAGRDVYFAVGGMRDGEDGLGRFFVWFAIVVAKWQLGGKLGDRKAPNHVRARAVAKNARSSKIMTPHPQHAGDVVGFQGDVRMTRILEIRNTVVPIASDIRNAFIDFSKMTASVVAVVTDAIVDGKPVVGYGINSNGRYNAKGILEDRIIPRVLDADASGLNDPETGLLCPHRVAEPRDIATKTEASLTTESKRWRRLSTSWMLASGL